MKKLPEFVALSIGLGLLSLMGAIAWQSVEADQLSTPLADDVPSASIQSMPVQAGVVSGR